MPQVIEKLLFLGYKVLMCLMFFHFYPVPLLGELRYKADSR